MPQVFDLSTFTIGNSIEKYFPKKQQVCIIKVLNIAGYQNLAQLCAATENDLKSLPAFGPKRTRYVQEALRRLGLCLRTESRL